MGDKVHCHGCGHLIPESEVVSKRGGLVHWPPQHYLTGESYPNPDDPENIPGIAESDDEQPK